MSQSNINVPADTELKEQFSREVPNDETLKAIEDVQNGRNIYGTYSTVAEMMKALDAPD